MHPSPQNFDFVSSSYALQARAAKTHEQDFLTSCDDPDGLLGLLYPTVRHLTCLDVFRVRILLDAFRKSLHLPGDLIECGVFRGGTGLLLGLALKKLGSPKRVLLCDTFQGLPRPDPRFDRIYQEGWFATEESALRSRIKSFELSDTLQVEVGLFEDTLPRLPKETRLSFAHIDADLYHSTTCALAEIYPRLADGAPIVFDDFHDESGGVRKAVEAHVDSTGETLQLGAVGQVVLFKGVKQPGPRFGTSLIAGLPAYSKFLSELHADGARRLGDLAALRQLCRPD